jgi:hypothetical protein
MAYWHYFRDPQCNETFAHAHAFVQISLTDGSFLELGIDFQPARGPYDVERALQDCETDEEFMAVLHAYVKCDEGVTDARQLERRTLTDDEFACSQRLLEDALGTDGDEP